MSSKKHLAIFDHNYDVEKGKKFQPFNVSLSSVISKKYPFMIGLKGFYSTVYLNSIQIQGGVP